jgi:putative two-component system response regulator
MKMENMAYTEEIRIMDGATPVSWLVLNRLFSQGYGYAAAVDADNALAVMLANGERRAKLEYRIRERAGKPPVKSLDMVTLVSYALEAIDKYTGGHSLRVYDIAGLISEEMGMGRNSINKVKLAGLVHDIGKIGIEESVLTKEGKLTDEEYTRVSAHCVIGERILGLAIDDEEILKIVRNHHERYDGAGYPDGISGEAIPLGARILAVADTYDAITSDRPYRRAASHREAVAELRVQSGLQLDPLVVEVFSRMVGETGGLGLHKRVAAYRA